MASVPSVSVYRPLLVRSMRAPRSSVPVSTTSATNSTARISRVEPATVRRFDVVDMVVASSVGFLEIDDDGAGVEPEPDRQQEEQHVAQIDDALGDCGEVGQETQA